MPTLLAFDERAVQAFLATADSLERTAALDETLREAAHRLVPHVTTTDAMVALLEAHQALNRAAAYEQCAPRDLPALARCMGGHPPHRASLSAWAMHQAEAWRELAWATAVNVVSADSLAAAVAR